MHLTTALDELTEAELLDHAEAVSRMQRECEAQGPPGRSRVGNYGPMTTFHHRVKTHGGWEVQQPFPGLYVWRDPHGATYVVDHSDTRRLPSLGQASPAEVGFARVMFDLAA